MSRGRKKKQEEPPGKLRWVALLVLLLAVSGGVWYALNDPGTRAQIDEAVAAAQEATEPPPPPPAPPPKPDTRWTYTNDNGVILFVKKRSDVPPKFRGVAVEVPAK